MILSLWKLFLIVYLIESVFLWHTGLLSPWYFSCGFWGTILSLPLFRSPSQVPFAHPLLWYPPRVSSLSSLSAVGPMSSHGFGDCLEANESRNQMISSRNQALFTSGSLSNIKYTAAGPVLLNMVATSHMWLLEIKLIKIKLKIQLVGCTSHILGAH